jgi:hypothetical protein
MQLMRLSLRLGAVVIGVNGLAYLALSHDDDNRIDPLVPRYRPAPRRECRGEHLQSVG